MTSGPEPGWAAGAEAVAHVIVDGPLVTGLTVGGADGHHLARARRLRPGERVTAADGDGRWRPYLVSRAGRGSIVLEASGPERVEPALEPGLTVAFALTKGGKPEVVVAALTALGVDGLVPFTAARSLRRWDAARAEAGRRRLALAAREAAAQSRRSRLPRIDAPADFEDLPGHPGLVLADRSGAPASSPPRAGPEGWLVVVGPEGGLAPRELEALAAVPRLAVGPHVLRAETAAIAAAATLAAWRRPAGAGRADGGHGG